MNDDAFQVPGYDHYSYTWEYTMTTSNPLSEQQQEAVTSALLDAEVPMPESILKVFTTDPQP